MYETGGSNEDKPRIINMKDIDRTINGRNDSRKGKLEKKQVEMMKYVKKTLKKKLYIVLIGTSVSLHGTIISLTTSQSKIVNLKALILSASLY